MPYRDSSRHTSSHSPSLRHSPPIEVCMETIPYCWSVPRDALAHFSPPHNAVLPRYLFKRKNAPSISAPTPHPYTRPLFSLVPTFERLTLVPSRPIVFAMAADFLHILGRKVISFNSAEFSRSALVAAAAAARPAPAADLPAPARPGWSRTEKGPA